VKFLIVSADDFCLADEVNRASPELRRRIAAAGVGCGGFADAARWRRRSG
jgi:hypothetical protein